MAHIEISNLNSAGSDLFASADSFLTELKTTAGKINTATPAGAL